ncbi:MAG: hypothetical protein Q6J68_03970 [Thermostichales cyanobacterium SZTDM-1c_bins_54]
MEPLRLGIAGVGLVVVAAELWRTRRLWPWHVDLLKMLGLSGLGLLLLIWGVGIPGRIGLGLGVALGLLLLAVGPYGRAPQGLLVLLAAFSLPGDPQRLIPLLAGLGVGAGAVGIPVAMRMGWEGLWGALTQLWLGLAALMWGSHLLRLYEGDQSWLIDGLPLAMAVPVGVGAILAWWQEEQLVPLTRLGGVILGGITMLIVEQNLLGHSGSLSLYVSVGMVLGVVISLWPRAGTADQLWQAAITLALAGGAALLALRLGGAYGAAMMGLGCLLVPGAEAMALFLGARPLVQSLIYGYGLTSLNLTHSYTNAGLFLGLAAVALGGLVWGSRSDWGRGSLLLGWTALAVLGIGYFFHTLPQATWLLGALMAGFLVAILAPLTPLPWQSWGRAALVLVGWGALLAVLTPELLQAGIDASRWQRLTVLMVIVAALSLIVIAWRLIGIPRSSQPL